MSIVQCESDYYMEIRGQDVLRAISEAIKNVECRIGEDQKKQNAERSISFIKQIQQNLEAVRKEYNLNDSVEIFSRYRKEKFTPFRLKELLFDIHICVVDFIKINHTEKYFIKESLVQIESEFGNMQEVLKDFSKLICGNGQIKIMILSDSLWKYEIELKQLAKHNCNGSLYIIFFPHPETWDPYKMQNATGKIYHFIDGNLVPYHYTE